MPQQLGTLLKATKVLDALEKAAPVGVLELSRRLGMDKSAVSRILTTLKSCDYVRVTEEGHYDLGLRLFELGRTMQERMPIREAVIPHVDAIVHETGETAFAVHWSQGQIAYLYDCVSMQDIRLGGRSGVRALPWNHPAGKAILAYHPEAAVFKALSSARRKQRMGLPTVEHFRRELTRNRKQGYVSQHDAEICLIAVPVLNDTAPSCLAIMLGGPAFRMLPSQTKSFAKLLIKHAGEVSRSLDWIAKRK